MRLASAPDVGEGTSQRAHILQRDKAVECAIVKNVSASGCPSDLPLGV
jgi:hypothetical protein